MLSRRWITLSSAWGIRSRAEIDDQLQYLTGPDALGAAEGASDLGQGAAFLETLFDLRALLKISEGQGDLVACLFRQADLVRG